MVYDMNQYQPMNDQNFNFGEFIDAFGNTIQNGVENIGSNFDANALNSLAIANLNKAQADAIKSNAENKKQITKNIFTVLIIAIVGIVVVVIAQKFWK